ncbi:hypothetical protein OSTOST_09457, partial [Ostertagia ostertagi]
VAGAAAAVGAAVGVVAAPPLQFWIRDKAKARIKCVKPSCPIRIHENDINAVLDEQEDALNLFMPLDHRQYLQYYHNKDVIYYAFGGNEYVKQCPLCKVFERLSMYIEKEGCSYVTCANLRCRTRFCWQCGEPIESIMHFTGQTCRVGYDDIERGLFWVKLAVDVRAFALILYVPVFFLACWNPSVRLARFPQFPCSACVQQRYSEDGLPHHCRKILVAFKMVSIFLAGIPVGLFLALNSIVTGGTIFAIYVAFTVFKASPYAKFLEEGYDLLLPMAHSAGLGPFKQMLKDGKEAKKRRKQQLKEQAEAESSERAQIVEGRALYTANPVGLISRTLNRASVTVCVCAA